jgi:hypothetical protein
MITALVLVVGGVVVWLVADHLLTWLRDRRPDGPSSWHGQGPGTTFHSSGFEDTVPPHEAIEPARGAIPARR